MSSKIGQPEQRFSRIGRITILTNQAEGVRGLLQYLGRYAAESSILSANEVGRLAITAPDIVVIAPDTGDSWTKQPQSALRQVFASYKVVAMGPGGAQLFSQLGLQIDGHVMHLPSASPVIVQNPALLKPLSISSSDGALQVSQPGGDSIGAYDEGATDLAGFEGIANWQNADHHWPIARQGNYVLWGFDANFERMTEAGQRLFVNLLIDQRLQSPVPLSQARKKFEYVEPGLLSDRLTAQFPTKRVHFLMREPGRITARLSWNPAERPLALMLLPDRQRCVVRKDGISPIEIAFDVADQQVSAGVDWEIDLAAFRGLGDALIDYKLELSFPRLRDLNRREFAHERGLWIQGADPMIAPLK